MVLYYRATFVLCGDLYQGVSVLGNEGIYSAKLRLTGSSMTIRVNSRKTRSKGLMQHVKNFPYFRNLAAMP